MMSLRARWAIIGVIFLMSVLWSLPNFVKFKEGQYFTDDKMVQGLDIQGGLHLVLGVDSDSVFSQEAVRQSAHLRDQMREKGISVSNAEVGNGLIGEVRFTFADQAAREKGEEWLNEIYGPTYQTIESSGATLAVRHPEAYLTNRRKQLVEQAIETIRNRIDEFGVAEPNISAQGSNRILVQLPGIKDASQAKDLVNRTARLDFMLVHDSWNPDELRSWIAEAETNGKFFLQSDKGKAEGSDPSGEKQGLKYSDYIVKVNEALKGKIPPNTIVYLEKDQSAVEMRAGYVPYLLHQDKVVGGDLLTDAFVTTGQYGQPVVSFRFDAEGTKQFGQLTRENVRKPFAIVLDRVVKSAPMIKEPITGGSGQIEMGRSNNEDTFKEAELISMALRSGALPAPLQQLEERTVGPSLGQEAIQKGEIAGLFACILVFVFMIAYYRSFGVVASICLAFNLLIVIAILSALNATLTLPGIAGMALTVGMAVDANVIIYERIKEELANGVSLSGAVREGFDRAFSSIFDANITTAFVCVILMYYGTGPIRGFAVTLICGLVASMFTSIFFTRALLETMINRLKWNLSIKWG